MNTDNFERLVSDGIKAIPEKFLKKLENVEIIIEDKPTPYQLEKLKLRKNEVLFGLYEGVPMTKRMNYAQVLPDKITIFKNEIERYASSPEEIKEIVKNTVWHEIAHHFGMDEKRVRDAESRKKTNL